MSQPLTNLGEILRSLDVEVRPEPYVVTVVTGRVPPEAAAVITEDEGVTVVLSAGAARHHGIPDAPAFAWLTLTVHSSLEAVGLTAAVSTALAEAGISCNVLAGFHHDHLLVPYVDRDRAARVIRDIRDRYR